MQLRSLEIFGFKSFGERTKFLFDKGITGIVGPNGCGKSNVVDSIRWVLGEQKTRNLRSEKMENIIFNGTSKRKRANFAEVTLTFDNTKNILPTEYTTVSITRKLYRSGDSEYKINQVNCRLKDIQSLFLDTGVGPDSYAIIELKMVDEILNDKENSRRVLFEEAAGISKYKVRKKQTLKKLADTQKDLERVEDVLFEIQKNLKSLENQAKKAKRYFGLKEKYKLVSSRFAWFRIRDLRETYETIEKEEQSFSDKVTEIQTRIALMEARIQEVKLEQVDNEKFLIEAQKDLNEHNEKIQTIETEKSIKNERLKYLQQREFAIQDQLETDKKQRIRTEEELELARKRLDEVKKEFGGKEESLKKLKRELESLKEMNEEHKRQNESLNAAHRETEQGLQKMQKDREIKLIQIEGLTNEMKRNQADRDSRTNELDSFADKLKELTVEKATLEKTFNALKTKKQEQDKAIEETGLEINTLKDTIYKTNRSLDVRTNEYKLTKSLVESLEGFPDSVKFLKKEARWIKDAPLLSDVFYAEEGYKVAFENLLEPYLSYFVVDNRDDAASAVKLLSDSSKGRANFFLLEELNDYKARPRLIMEGAQSALDVVEFSEQYSKLAEFLLDRVYLTDSDFIEPKEATDDLIYVSKSGEIHQGRFTLSGGSVGLFQGKRLGRAKNMEKLEKQIKKYEKELNKQKNELVRLERHLHKLKSEDHTKELDKLSTEFSQKSASLSVLKAREQEYQEFIKKAGERSEVIEVQISSLTEEVEGILPKIEELNRSFTDQSGMLEEARRMLDNSNEEVAEQSQAYNNENISFIQSRNLLDNLTQDSTRKSDSIQQLLTNEEKGRLELEKTRKDIHGLVENNLQNDEEIVGMYELKKVKETRKEKYEQISATLRQAISEVDDKIRKERQTKDGQEERKNQIREKVTEIKIQLNSLKERMQVEFKVDISDLDEEDLFDNKPGEFKADEIEANMLKIRDRIQNYGEINPMAVEAFDEMKERYDFIIEQRKDLEDARQTLLDTIAEIDRTATEKFMEAFFAIRKNFKEVFQHLFYEGDTCDLILFDPEDPLESKINILAKPKGKRPLTINQLSGGEKTLTAISLLFAIYLLKPAPFCIFDEVDAPLDDANIDKFNNIIRDFSKDSQFIIVTHNKRTMASTNVMYGVTMEKQGVSKVLPVDLVALNLTEN